MPSLTRVRCLAVGGGRLFAVGRSPLRRLSLCAVLRVAGLAVAVTLAFLLRPLCRILQLLEGCEHSWGSLTRDFCCIWGLGSLDCRWGLSLGLCGAALPLLGPCQTWCWRQRWLSSCLPPRQGCWAPGLERVSSGNLIAADISRGYVRGLRITSSYRL